MKENQHYSSVGGLATTHQYHHHSTVTSDESDSLINCLYSAYSNRQKLPHCYCLVYRLQTINKTFKYVVLVWTDDFEVRVDIQVNFIDPEDKSCQIIPLTTQTTHQYIRTLYFLSSSEVVEVGVLFLRSKQIFDWSKAFPGISSLVKLILKSSW